MLGQQPCADFLIEAVKHLWTYAVSDEGHLVFASAATARSIVYYLGQMNLPEARKLATTITVSLVLALTALAVNRVMLPAMPGSAACKRPPMTESTAMAARHNPF